MTILITGSSGFIGTHLAKYLKKSHKVIGVDRKEGKEVLDITEDDLKDIDIVIHLAAQTSVWNENIKLIENDNIRSFIHIFQLCKKLNKRFIYASSSCSINITSMYGLSKHFDDVFAKIYGWKDCIGLRFHNVYGKDSRNDTLLGICLNNDSIKLWNNGLNYRHFTYIDDICKGIEKAFTLKQGLYNIVNPQENSVIEFVNEVKKYKDIGIILLEEKRNLDKERQKIDDTHLNLIQDNFISIEEGLKKVFK